MLAFAIPIPQEVSLSENDCPEGDTGVRSLFLRGLCLSTLNKPDLNANYLSIRARVLRVTPKLLPVYDKLQQLSISGEQKTYFRKGLEGSAQSLSLERCYNEVC